MRVFVTGVNGQLGHDVMRELYSRAHEGIGCGSAVCGVKSKDNMSERPYVQLDITDERRTVEVISRLRPEAVIHCAAWTAVDAAERPENLSRVYAVNEYGTMHIAKACRMLGCKMLYISTDYVFNGKGTEPWRPEDKEFEPLNVYGQTKLAGEFAVSGMLDRYFIVRISWVFGRTGNNFVKTMLNLAETHNTIHVVNDQIGTPTYTADLASLLVDMVETDHYGYYHATNEGGYISWYDFACEIYSQAGLSTRVIPISTEEYVFSKAARPLNSRMDKSKLSECGFQRLPDWKDAVIRYLAELKF